MANDENPLKEIMQTFESAWGAPKLSEQLFGEKVSAPTIEDVREIPNEPEVTVLDRLEIIPGKTKPGWYQVGEKKFYLSQGDIPKTESIRVGEKRGTTIYPKRQSSPFVRREITISSQPSDVKYGGSYTGRAEIDKSKLPKPEKYQDNINPSTVIHRPSKNIEYRGGDKAYINLETGKLELRQEGAEQPPLR